MDFKNYKDNAKKLGIGGDYFKLDSGENKFRILTEPEPTASHYIAQGTKPAQCTQDPTCEYCAKGIKVSYKVILYVLDRKDNQVKLAELPWSIYKAIGELANSSEYGFKSLPPYDLIVIRSGEGKEVRYQTTPGRDETPVPANILEGKKPISEILQKKFSALSDLPF